jgi:glycosyltransferase involved in cell wall biosynthesis
MSPGPNQDGLRDGDRPTRIAVMVATYRRPKMLAGLLSSFGNLVKPNQAEIDIFVVDNDPDGSARPVVDQFRARAPLPTIHYVLEKRTGIPFARNRALDEAAARGADLAAFVDDDEVADPRWLTELVATQRSRALNLVGGPVRVVVFGDTPKLTAWQSVLLDGVRWRYAQKERRAAERADRGREGEIVIVTNNWMIDMKWWAASGLRFDETLRYSGGSDALFFSRAVERNVRSGWCKTAVVSDVIPVSRLSMTYQFTRARSQANTNFFRKYRTRSPARLAFTFGAAAIKLIAGAVCLVAIPVARGPAAVQGARAIGWAIGRVEASLGIHSEFYSRTDGQ